MHMHQEFIEKQLQAKMSSLIINCKEIKNDVSKRKKKNKLGCRILYCTGVEGAAVSYQTEDPDGCWPI